MKVISCRTLIRDQTTAGAVIITRLITDHEALLTSGFTYRSFLKMLQKIIVTRAARQHDHHTTKHETGKIIHMIMTHR